MQFLEKFLIVLLVISGYKNEVHDALTNGETTSLRLCDELKTPVIVRSNTRPSWVGSMADNTEVKLYRIMKVTPEGNQVLSVLIAFFCLNFCFAMIR